MVQLFAETLRTIVEGELRQLFSSRQWRQPKDAYYPRIFAKTASLFASATRSGAILGGATAEQEQALYDYGHHFGMAFQIVDDILDFAGEEATLGKPVGGDLRQGIMTLPFFYYLQAQPNPRPSSHCWKMVTPVSPRWLPPCAPRLPSGKRWPRRGRSRSRPRRRSPACPTAHSMQLYAILPIRPLIGGFDLCRRERVEHRTQDSSLSSSALSSLGLLWMKYLRPISPLSS